MRDVQCRRAAWRHLAVTAALATMLIAGQIAVRHFAPLTLEIETGPDKAEVWIDGQHVAEIEFLFPLRGGIALQLHAKTRADLWQDSVAPAQAWDSVVVTERSTGLVLLSDQFDGHSLSGWTIQQGEPLVSGGLARGEQPELLIAKGGASWVNYRVSARIRAPVNASLRALTATRGRFLETRISLLRRNMLRIRIADGDASHREQLVRFNLSLTKQLAMLLDRVLPTAVNGVILYAGAVGLLLLLMAVRRIVPGAARRVECSLATGSARRLAGWTPWLCAAAVATTAAWINRELLRGIPHVQDSVAYVMQAKLFSSGKIWAEAPKWPMFFSQQFMLFTDGRLVSQYLFGHPLLLAIGNLLGAPWLTPIVLSAVNIVLTARLAARLFGRLIGAVSALFLAVSPFYLLMHGTFMAHPTGLFYGLAALNLALPRRADSKHTASPRAEERWWRWASAGVLLGLLAATRPFTVPGYALALALLAPAPFRKGREKAGGRAWAALMLGLAAMTVAIMGYNAALTGNPLSSPYDIYLGRNYVGANFAGVDTGNLPKIFHISHLETQLASLMAAYLAWPAGWTLALPLIPLLARRCSRHDWMLYGGVTVIIAVRAFYRIAVISYGPRYYFEALPFIAILSARGALAAADRQWLPFSSHRASPSPPGNNLLRCGLALSTALALLLSIPAAPQRIDALRGDNVLSRAILDQSTAMKLRAAVIFVVPPQLGGDVRQANAVLPPSPPDHRLAEGYVRSGQSHIIVGSQIWTDFWSSYGSVYPANSPNFETSLIFARYLGPHLDYLLMQEYPARAFYTATYPKGDIQPYLRPFTPRWPPPDQTGNDATDHALWLTQPVPGTGPVTFAIVAGIGETPLPADIYVNHEHAGTVTIQAQQRSETSYFGYRIEFTPGQPVAGPFGLTAMQGLLTITLPAGSLTNGEAASIRLDPRPRPGEQPLFFLYEITNYRDRALRSRAPAPRNMLPTDMAEGFAIMLDPSRWTSESWQGIPGMRMSRMGAWTYAPGPPLCDRGD